MLGRGYFPCLACQQKQPPKCHQPCLCPPWCVLRSRGGALRGKASNPAPSATSATSSQQRTRLGDAAARATGEEEKGSMHTPIPPAHLLQLTVMKHPPPRGPRPCAGGVAAASAAAERTPRGAGGSCPPRWRPCAGVLGAEKLEGWASAQRQSLFVPALRMAKSLFLSPPPFLFPPPAVARTAGGCWASTLS